MRKNRDEHPHRLEVGEQVFYGWRTGQMVHQYEYRPTKVVRVSKTLAYLENGYKVYRDSSPSNIGYYWKGKGNDHVHPDNWENV